MSKAPGWGAGRAFTGGPRSERFEWLPKRAAESLCRYAEPGNVFLGVPPRCAYWDDNLLGTEIMLCLGGRDCYEPNAAGVIFDDRDGQWKSLVEFLRAPRVEAVEESTQPSETPLTPPPPGLSPGLLTPRYCEKCEQRTVVPVNDWLVCTACGHRRLVIFKDEPY